MIVKRTASAAFSVTFESEQELRNEHRINLSANALSLPSSETFPLHTKLLVTLVGPWGGESFVQATVVAPLPNIIALAIEGNPDEILGRLLVRTAAEPAIESPAGLSFAASATPKGPEISKAPETPKTLETPKVHETPKTLETPKAHETPKILETPNAPETPKAHETSNASEASDSEGDSKQTAWDRIRGLSHMEKLLLAVKADRTERSLLLQDSDARVLLSLLRNPRLTVDEVVRIAKSSFLTYQVADTIAKTSPWMAGLEVRLALIHNPKTPPAIALAILPLLPDSEVRTIARTGTNMALKQAALRRLQGRI